MSIRRATFVVTAASTLLASAAFAVPITPNVTAIAVNENNPVGGSLAAPTQSQPFATSNYTGTLVSNVITGDTSNPYGGLTFTYQLINDAGSANALARLNVNGFTGYATDVSYKLGTGTVAPTYNDRDATGSVMGFTFLGQPLGLGTLSAGGSSELLVIQTNALGFRTVIANVSNGAVSPVNAYAAAGNITPEPATLAALGGAIAIAARRRR